MRCRDAISLLKTKDKLQLIGGDARMRGRRGCVPPAATQGDARDAGDAISAFSRKSLAKSFPSIGAAKWVLSLSN